MADVEVLYGPFHRLETPTQTTADALKQVASGEIWGKPARWSDIPSVKAYRGTVPPGDRGIEFTTGVRAEKGSGSRLEAKWYYPQTEGTMLRQNQDGDDCAAIPATVKNLQL